MGAWGEEPKDNDATWDLWGLCCDAINVVVQAQLGTMTDVQGDFEQAGLIQLLLEKGVPVRWELVEIAAKHLRAALTDKKWIARWRSPKSAARQIVKVAAAMEALKPKLPRLLKRRRSRCTEMAKRTVLAWRGWPGKETSSWTKIETKTKKRR